MRKMIFVAAGLAIAAPAAAQTTDTGGFYAQLHAGSQGVKDPKGTFFDEPGTFGGDPDAATPDTFRVKFHAKSGASVGGTLGYDFGKVRFDVDLTYGKNKLDRIKVLQVNGAAPPALDNDDAQAFCDYLADDSDDEGDDEGAAAAAPTCTVSGNTISTGGSYAKLRQLGAIASLWFDIPTGGRIEPYVGGGIGATGYHAQTADDGDGKVRFAWQIGAGVAFKLSPHVALTADYRYRRVGGTTLFADEGSGLKLNALHTSLLSGGVRFTF